VSWVRCIVIASEDHSIEIEDHLLEKCTFRKLRTHNKHVLWTYEGRSVVALPLDRSLTLGADGRSPRFYSEGDSSLALAFGARLEFTIGITTSAEDRPRFDPSSKKIAKLIIKAFEAAEEEDDDTWNLRCDVSSTDLISANNSLGELAETLDRSNIDYRAGLFDGAFGIVAGNAEPGDTYIGPAVYVTANWTEQITKSVEVRLVINESEALLDGNSLVF
jgi:hypothetical protein